MLVPGQQLHWPCLILSSSAPRDWFQTECKTSTFFSDSITRVWLLNVWFSCFYCISETKRWSNILFINMFCLPSSQFVSLAILLHWAGKQPWSSKDIKCLHQVTKASSRVALWVHIKASMSGLFSTLVFNEKKKRC